VKFDQPDQHHLGRYPRHTSGPLIAASPRTGPLPATETTSYYFAMVCR
jgi:hypothetical protein